MAKNRRTAETGAAAVPGAGPLPVEMPGVASWVDAWQRSILFLDVLRQRGNQREEHLAMPVPHVLDFAVERVVDGRTLARPVNYGIVAITPPEGVVVDPRKRPFVVVDPRAGHGPGIGGFRADSEIGVALQAGHPCYFVGFTPEPMPGQTIEDVLEACALFLEAVIARHPAADGKPCVIGNCQAGWMMAMVAAMRPELFGPLILAGSPLSYWAGVHGRAPMRYTGGLLGGSWLTALTGDLGNGRFDGAWLVSNFENLNPANTLWSKQYNLWAKIDTEAPRYLGFERWWGSPVMLNAEEMQFIVDQLFVGNKLATAEIVTRAGIRLDLRQIAGPILCFCSKGDDITPPHQALGWITDLYASEEEIIARGQTIVYAIHESVGHLGIFVSGTVAKKEHQEFASNIDLIDCLPPGLYEAVMLPRAQAGASAEPVVGDHLVRFERRSLEDLRALGGNDPEDERRFATVARISEINLGLYRTFLQPVVRASASEESAARLRALHPTRLGYELFSDKNPLMAPVAELAEQVRATRRVAPADDPLVQLREQTAQAIASGLEAWGELRDRALEATFHAIYGSPLVQALAGLRASDAPPRRRPGVEPEERALTAARIADLRQRIATGGPREAVLRALIWIGMPGGVVDERSFNVLNAIRASLPTDLPLAELKALIRDQFMMVRLDPEAAIAAVPALVGPDRQHREAALEVISRVATAAGAPEGERAARLARIEAMLGQSVAMAPARPARRVQGGTS